MFYDMNIHKEKKADSFGVSELNMSLIIPWL